MGLGGIVLLGAVLAACGGRAEVALTPRPVASAGALGSTSGAVALTRAEVVRALATVGLQLEDARVPFRAPEPTTLDAARRAIVRVLLPDDPTHGFITIYEFPTPGAAADAGRDLATYLRSGFGRAQFPLDARHSIRQVGTTIVYFTWSPASSPDPRTGDIETALAGVGSEVELPG